MKEIAVLIPSLRTERWDAIRENVERLGIKVYFDSESPSYAKAINNLFKKTKEPYFFCGADDLDFKEGWTEKALALMKGKVRVVGTNDLHHPGVLEGKHATHFLVDRRYIDEVGGVEDQPPGIVLYPFHHNFVDTLFIETARARRVYDHAHDSVVEHRHHYWNKDVKIDKVYKKTGHPGRFEEDMRNFQVERLKVLNSYDPWE